MFLSLSLQYMAYGMDKRADCQVIHDNIWTYLLSMYSVPAEVQYTGIASTRTSSLATQSSMLFDSDTVHAYNTCY